MHKNRYFLFTPLYKFGTKLRRILDNPKDENWEVSIFGLN